jgi:MerR family copper efflux transcriptional regulator
MNQAERKQLKVGDLAKAVGKTVRAIHLYEELGLLVPVSRSTGNYRLYSEEAVARVNWIVRLQDAGLSLAEIQGLLRDWEQAPSGSAGMHNVREMFARKLAETRDTLTRLAALEHELVASLDYLDSCRSCAPSHVQSACKRCEQQGHVASEAPVLVLGLVASQRAAVAAPASVPGNGLPGTLIELGRQQLSPKE